MHLVILCERLQGTLYTFLLKFCDRNDVMWRHDTGTEEKFCMAFATMCHVMSVITGSDKIVPCIADTAGSWR